MTDRTCQCPSRTPATHDYGRPKFDDGSAQLRTPVTPDPRPIELGQVAYEAYRASTGGVSLATGDPLPMWAALRLPIREAWRGAADGVRMFLEMRP